MKNVLLYAAIAISTSAIAQQAESPLDSIISPAKPIQLDEVLVSSVRATKKLPVTFSISLRRKLRPKISVSSCLCC